MACMPTRSPHPDRPPTSSVGDPAARIATTAGFIALPASNVHTPAIGPGHVVHAWDSNLRFALGDTADTSAPTMVTVP